MNKQELIALVKELLKEKNSEEKRQELQLIKKEYKYI